MKTYTLVDSYTGRVYSRGLRADVALQEILVHDNNKYEIVEEKYEDGRFAAFRLWWTGRPFMDMAPTIYVSTEPDFYEAVNEIAEKVLSNSVRADFPLHAWEDQEWDFIVAESESED
jgi:hypothetical protein